MQFILASASPRRREILEQMGLQFSVRAADIDESSTATDPAALVEELSLKKAQAVAKTTEENAVIIGADTVVAAADEILGKPKNEADARRMLRLLSGSTHRVFTGVTLIYEGVAHTAHCITEVTIQQMTNQEIEEYIASGEPYDKAGGYAAQGRAARYIVGINGCYWNVVGFPVNLFFNMLKQMGIHGV